MISYNKKGKVSFDMLLKLRVKKVYNDTMGKKILVCCTV